MNTSLLSPRNLSFGFLLLLLPLFLNSAKANTPYWDSGLAEISRYELKQARYGALHKGEAILLFVTEPFSSIAQVKDDSGKDPNARRVLKLNSFKRFNTGVYDYSIMSSVFSSMEADNKLPTFKVTTSVQDWCGQVFNQWNQRDAAWESELRSYFQAEGDSDQSVELVPHEDGIWNRIRIDPESLPLGDFEMIPSSAFLRLKHKPIKAYSVTASLKSGVYKLYYPNLNRTLSINFRQKAPHEIEGWTESYPERGEKLLTTEAKRTHDMRSYYWEQNQPSYLKLRKKLGLK